MKWSLASTSRRAVPRAASALVESTPSPSPVVAAALTSSLRTTCPEIEIEPLFPVPPAPIHRALLFPVLADWVLLETSRTIEVPRTLDSTRLISAFLAAVRPVQVGGPILCTRSAGMDSSLRMTVIPCGRIEPATSPRSSYPLHIVNCAAESCKSHLLATFLERSIRLDLASTRRNTCLQ